MQTLEAHAHADEHHKGHKQGHDPRLAHELTELSGHPVGIQAHKVTPGGFQAVQQQPSGDDGVEHHQQIVARNAKPAVPVPLGPLGLQHVEGAGNAPLAPPAHGQLHDHHRQP